MFALLKGKIVLIEEESIVIDVLGVGYLVNVASNLLSYYNLNEDVVLHIQTIVKEDAINLYGFTSIEEKKLFNLLITVQGVGAKIALLILAKMNFEEIQKVILFEDIETLKTIQGIGTKVAQRIVNELKDKINRITINYSAIVVEDNKSNKKTNSDNNNMSVVNDAIEALKALGYNSIEINNAITKIKKEKIKYNNTEDVIKAALQLFAKDIK